MASGSIPSSPRAAIVMNPNGLGLGKTPTTSKPFIEELEIMGFSGTMSSDDAKKDLEWLESWNPAKVLPAHTGAEVIETGLGNVIEGGDMNISSHPLLALEEAQFSELLPVPSEWDESPRTGTVDSPVRLGDMTSDLEESTSAGDSTTPPTSSDEFDDLPIGPQTIHEADRWCKDFLASLTPTTGTRKRKATTEPSTGVQTKKARVINVSRAHISGFPSMSEPLPAGLLHEEIIKRYPNHLRGELLLDIAENWTPKQIVETCGQPQLKSNTIVKRIHAAKEARDGFRARRKPKTVHPSSTASPTVVEDRSPTAQTAAMERPESEASRLFRLTQTDIHHILVEWDADFFTTLADRDRKGMADQDRALIELAAVERERRLSMLGPGAESLEE